MTTGKKRAAGKTGEAAGAAAGQHPAAPSLGHDPLAWLAQESTDEAEALPERIPAADAASPAVVSGPLALGKELTIQGVNELHAHWLSQLDGAGAAGIDGAEVTQVDGAGLQLLLSLVQTIEARGASVRWTGVSDTLLEGARTLGLVEALRLQPSGASA